MKLGHFDKRFVKNTKNDPQGKILELFLIDTLKNYILNGRFKKMDIRALGPFFQNKGTFFDFHKKPGEASPPWLRACKR